MPNYTFRITTDEGHAEMDLGFSKDESAIVYGRSLAGEAAVEVWLGPRRITEHLPPARAARPS